MTSPSPAEPPRVVLIGENPPEQTRGGELFLYRLFADHPADRLLVLYGTQHPRPDATVRLPGIDHRTVGSAFRLPRWARPLVAVRPVFEQRAVAGRADRVAAAVGNFRPDVCVVVSEQFVWLAGAAWAARAGVPLALISHDDYAQYITANSPKPWHRLARVAYRRTYGRVYRQARTRFCVSPGMADLYTRRYGCPGTILYPFRGEDSPDAEVRVGAAGGPPVVAFAGTLHTAGAVELLRRLADLLAPVGGFLDLYTRADAAQLGRFGLVRPNVRPAGFQPTVRAMAARVAETAHALFLPATFLDRERTDVSTLFPSKLADYTAIGLPVLIWGPEHSSAVRWSRANPDAAVTVSDPAGAEVLAAVVRLAEDREYAARVAAGGVAAGKRYFTLDAARTTFRAGLADATRSASPRG